MPGEVKDPTRGVNVSPVEREDVCNERGLLSLTCFVLIFFILMLMYNKEY